LADDKVYGDKVKVAEINKKYSAEKHLLEHAQKAWEDLAAEIMELEG
jgi:ATP-binding cassette subfamily F protein 3